MMNSDKAWKSAQGRRPPQEKDSDRRSGEGCTGLVAAGWRDAATAAMRTLQACNSGHAEQHEQPQASQQRSGAEQRVGHPSVLRTRVGHPSVPSAPVRSKADPH